MPAKIVKINPLPDEGHPLFHKPAIRIYVQILCARPVLSRLAAVDEEK